MRSKGWGSVGGLMTVTARYEDGVFKPLQDVRISEGTAAEVRIPSVGGRLKNRARSVADFTFFGMWKDRTDIGDSVEYLNRLRRGRKRLKQSASGLSR